MDYLTFIGVLILGAWAGSILLSLLDWHGKWQHRRRKK